MLIFNNGWRVLLFPFFSVLPHRSTIHLSLTDCNLLYEFTGISPLNLLVFRLQWYVFWGWVLSYIHALVVNTLII
jgi:hypothetical protein